jgi:hypothetical protein
MRRRLLSVSAVLIVLGWGARPALAQTQTAPASPSNVLPADQPADAKPDPDQPTDVKPDDPQATKPPDPQKPDPQKPGPRAEPQTPGTRKGIAAGDTVTVGGYGSVRYETNSLDEPKPAGFDFRRFVLATDISPNDRLKAYTEIEFERFANIEVERSADRLTNGAAFAEELEGGNGGEISIEQMWGQYKFSSPFSVRFGMILPPVGRFNIAHDDDRWDIPRRTLVDRNAPVLPVPAAWTELGFGFIGSMNVGKSGQLNYQAYVVNGAILDFSMEKSVESETGEAAVSKLAAEFQVQRGPVNGVGGTRAGTWRLAYSPTLSAEIGVSGYHGKYTPEFLDPVTANLNVFGLDGLYKHGSLAVEGEYIHTDFGNTDRVVQAFIDTVTGSTGIPPLAGADGTASEFTVKSLTPMRQGYWVEGRYHFWPKKWGEKSVLHKGFEDPQLTWVLRYERATLKDAIDEVAIENGEVSSGDRQTLRQERATVGLSYRPIQSVVFAVALEHNRRLQGDVLIFPFGAPSQAYTDLIVGMAFGF